MNSSVFGWMLTKPRLVKRLYAENASLESGPTVLSVSGKLIMNVLNVPPRSASGDDQTGSSVLVTHSKPSGSGTLS